MTVHRLKHQSAVSEKAEVKKKGKRKKVARCQNATPQIEQQVASDTLINHFPLFSVKTELDAREMGVK